MPDRPGAAGVRAAAPHDLYAAHAFLPWIASAAVPLDGLFIAHDAAGVCGVGALSTIQRGDALRADIFVHPDARRLGLGSGLLAHLAVAARAWGAAQLRSWRPTDAQPAQAFLAHAGALPVSRLLSFEATRDVSAFQRRLGPRAAAAAARVRPLRDTDVPALVMFYAQHLGDTAQAASQRLRATLADPVLSALSVGWERDGALRAFVVFQADDDGTPRLDFWYVDPSVRGSSSLALVAAAVQRALDLGLARVRFQCRDDARSTLRMARELGLNPCASRPRMNSSSDARVRR